METEFILTFETSPQIFVSRPILPFPTKKEQIAFCKGLAMGFHENEKLIKVSMCVMYGQNPAPKLPKWYDECNGKLWKDELE